MFNLIGEDCAQLAKPHVLRKTLGEEVYERDSRDEQKVQVEQKTVHPRFVWPSSVNEQFSYAVSLSPNHCLPHWVDSEEERDCETYFEVTLHRAPKKVESKHREQGKCDEIYANILQLHEDLVQKRVDRKPILPNHHCHKTIHSFTQSILCQHNIPFNHPACHSARWGKPSLTCVSTKAMIWRYWWSLARASSSTQPGWQLLFIAPS